MAMILDAYSGHGIALTFDGGSTVKVFAQGIRWGGSHYRPWVGKLDVGPVRISLSGDFEQMPPTTGLDPDIASFFSISKRRCNEYCATDLSPGVYAVHSLMPTTPGVNKVSFTRTYFEVLDKGDIAFLTDSIEKGIPDSMYMHFPAVAGIASAALGPSPSLTGTPRRRKWAQDIRREALQMCMTYGKGLPKEAQRLLAAILGTDNAKDIIDLYKPQKGSLQSNAMAHYL